MQSADDAALNAEIAKRLRRWRVLRQLSLAEAAAQLRISHVHLHRHEPSARKVSASMLYKLARVYGCTVGISYQDCLAKDRRLLIARTYGLPWRSSESPLSKCEV